MNVKFDPKSNTLEISSLSINPKSNNLSGTGKTYILGNDRAKLTIDGREATVSAIAYVKLDAKGKKAKR
jgi:hypothetical protein